MSDSDLYEIFKLLKTATYRAGSWVYKRGDAPSHIYIIKKGEVKIIVDAQDISLELISFGMGDCFGETSVIGIQPHSSGALAISEVELIVLERETLLNIYENNKETFGKLILNIARETARRLHNTDEALTEYILSTPKVYG